MKRGTSQAAFYRDFRNIESFSRSESTGAIERKNSRMSRAHRTFMDMDGLNDHIPALSDREKTILTRLIINCLDLSKHEKLQLLAKLLKENLDAA